MKDTRERSHPVTPETAALLRPQSTPELVLAKALLKAAALLGLSQKQIGAIVGLSESTVSRLGPSRPLSPDTKEGQLALLFLRLVRSLDALCGSNEDQVRKWFGAHNHHLLGVPAELVNKPEGLVHVVDYLDAMRGV